MISWNQLPKTQAVLDEVRINGLGPQKEKKMSNKKEIAKYEKKLSDLLDSLVYFKSHRDGKEYTPRSYFEENFKLLIDAPFMYFRAIADTADNHAADEELKHFTEKGAGARGAYHLMKEEVYALDGTTLGFIKYGATLSDSAYQMNEAIKQSFNIDTRGVML